MLRKLFRPATSLVEVLVVVGILAIVIGLLLPAVQQVRLSARRADTLDRLRQVGVSLHNFAGSHQERFPGTYGAPVIVDGLVRVARPGHLTSLLPYLDPSAAQALSGKGWTEGVVVPYLLDPSDPSLSASGSDGEPRTRADRSSYVVNHQAFGDREYQSPIAVRDGRSSTIAYAMRYALQCGRRGGTEFTKGMVGGATFADPPPKPQGNIIIVNAEQPDYPVTGGDPPVSRGNLGRTFYCGPPVTACDPRLAVSPYPQGLPIGFVDGSARLLRHDLAETTFWALVTADRGDQPEDF